MSYMSYPIGSPLDRRLEQLGSVNGRYISEDVKSFLDQAHIEGDKRTVIYLVTEPYTYYEGPNRKLVEKWDGSWHLYSKIEALASSKGLKLQEEIHFTHHARTLDTVKFYEINQHDGPEADHFVHSTCHRLYQMLFSSTQPTHPFLERRSISLLNLAKKD